MDVYSQDGDKIGSVQEIYYDEDTRQPEWIGIGTGFFGTKRVLVPVQGSTVTDDGVTVAYDKELVKDSPDVDGDVIEYGTEQSLHSHYGTSHADGYASSGAQAGTTAGGTDRQTGLQNVDEQSLTRSEEELRVGKRSVDAGTVRLRKWVETEPVQADVALRRETVHVNREPVDQVVTGAEIGERTIEVPLTDEEAVVDKQVVAKERISLDKDVEERTETVSDDVRRERVEVEGDDQLASRDR
jgi:uncharacterized protein (TIGR02271 family)